MTGKDSEDPGFTIVDRRGQESETQTPDPAAQAPPPGTPESGSPGPDAPEADAAGALPGIDFSTFCLSLATSALYHLGLVEDPETGGASEVNLPLARQTIDSLAMLQEKTRGNLDSDEEQLLQSLLTELRMRAVSGA